MAETFDPNLRTIWLLFGWCESEKTDMDIPNHTARTLQKNSYIHSYDNLQVHVCMHRSMVNLRTIWLLFGWCESEKTDMDIPNHTARTLQKKQLHT